MATPNTLAAARRAQADPAIVRYALITAALVVVGLLVIIPTVYVFVGSAIVAASGLFVIWRERQRGIERIRTSAIEGPPVGR